MKDVYINILIESLKKKSILLDNLSEIDEEQSKLLLSDKPDRTQIEKNLHESSKLACRIDDLDDGFESVYKKVRSELLDNSRLHRKEIELLKELIAEVTEKSVKIMAKEHRNRDTASERLIFSTKKKHSFLIAVIMQMSGLTVR